MGSLRDIKERIASVKSTRKITSAMRMIASSKLHKAQSAINNFLPYSEKLSSILSNLLSSDTGFNSPFSQKREVKKVALVAISSNSSLCGAFNANVIKEFNSVYREYCQRIGTDNIQVYAIGKKIADAARKQKVQLQDGNYDAILDKVVYEDVANLANDLINKYLIGEVDEVVVIYHHFKSTGTQILTRSTYLPVDLSTMTTEDNTASFQLDYILEPSRDEILSALIPKVLISKIYAVLLDSLASEHAARTMAMQLATDNAEELIQDLTIEYNKSRQQSITNELIDIIGGASALR